MDWKKSENVDGDKVLAALSVALNAEDGVNELFKRVAALELANAKSTTKINKEKKE